MPFIFIILSISVKVQAGLCLHNLILHDFTLTRFENVHHFLNLSDNVWFNTIWLRRYVIIFGLSHCGIHSLWSLLSGVGGQQKLMSLSHHQSRIWIDCIWDIITQLI